MFKQAALTQPRTGIGKVGTMRSFLVIWFGQLISLTGSGMTGFALGVWVYQQTGSATQFALIAMFNTLPRAILSPVAGVLADRYDRRTVMILADAGAALSTIFLLGMFAYSQIEIWHIYLGTLLNSSFNAFQFPAYSASIQALVPKEQLGRANGLVQLASAIGQIVSPAAAGLLIGLVSIPAIMLADLLSFLFAVGTLLTVVIPRPERSIEQRAESMGRQIVAGWRYLRNRPGLMGLMSFLVIGNYVVGVAAVLVAPMVLSFTTPDNLGLVQAVGGLGLLVGGIAMSAWGGGQHRALTFLSFYAMMGLGVLGVGLGHSILVIAAFAFLAYLSLPFVIGTVGAIINTKVEPEMQGRVTSLRVMAVMSAFTAAYITAGPLADRVFEPLLIPGGALADSLGQVLGVGPGYGMSLIFILMGIMTLVVVAVGFTRPRLRYLDSELPDVV